jgi:hypothetical protein
MLQVPGGGREQQLAMPTVGTFLPGCAGAQGVQESLGLELEADGCTFLL